MSSFTFSKERIKHDISMLMMASSSSTTQLLLLNCCKPLKLLPPVVGSLHSSTTPTNNFNVGGMASKKFNGVFSKLGRSPYRATPLMIINSRFAARSFHATTPAKYPDKSKSSDHLRYVFECFEFEKNPYLTAGPGKFCNVEEDEDALYARLDMPGVAKERLVLRVENGTTLWISGDESASKSKFQSSEVHRIYSTNIAVPSETYRTDQIMALLKNGVLRVVIPKLKNGDRTGSVHITVEDDLPDQHLHGCCSIALSSHTTTQTTPCELDLDKYNKAFEAYADAVNQLRENPFIREGPTTTLKYSPVGEVMYLRVDMPGVGKDGVKVWFEDDYLCFEGVEEEEEDKDLISYDKETTERRKYEGYLTFSKEEYTTYLSQIKTYFQHGVLRVAVPFNVEEYNKLMSKFIW